VRNIEFLNDPTAGEVRIGSIAPLATSLVSAVIDRLSRRYPRIAFHLVTAQPSTLQRELSERGIDLMIARSPIADERLGFEFLFEDSFVVAAGARSPWVRRRKIELRIEISNQALELKVLPVELPIAPVPNGIFTLKSRTLSPIAQLFIETAREVAKHPAKRK
jgi:DNA-binding transcriptional LysR family regulator